MVAPAIIGSAIGAGASLLGGALGMDSERKSRNMQREFAKNAIQWRVADAKKAGIHPLYAMGAPGIGGSFSSGNAMGDAIGRAGREVGRTVGGYDQRRQASELHSANLAESSARAAAARAAANRDNVLAAKTASDIKRAEQAINAQPTLGTGGPNALNPRRILTNDAVADGAGFRLGSGIGPILFDPNVSSAELAEERWGDIIQAIVGTYVGGKDLWYNRPRIPVPSRRDLRQESLPPDQYGP